MIPSAHRNEIFLFAGTSEGSEIARFLEEEKLPARVFVATEYGERMQREALDGGGSVQIVTGRLDRRALTALFTEEAPLLIVDATHPYATEISENLSAAAERCGVPLLRVLREASSETGDYTVASAGEAAALLKERFSSENILLTTGSKELPVFCAAELPKERLFVRILPDPIRRAEVLALGIQEDHIICRQGPFTESENLTLLRERSIGCLVTKEAGMRGGYEEKLSAAKRAGVSSVVIRRPKETGGISVETCKERIKKQWKERR